MVKLWRQLACTTGHVCAMGVSTMPPLRRTALFLLCEENPASLDGRYFGPVDASAEIGVAEPL